VKQQQQQQQQQRQRREDRGSTSTGGSGGGGGGGGGRSRGESEEDRGRNNNNSPNVNVQASHTEVVPPMSDLRGSVKLRGKRVINTNTSSSPDPVTIATNNTHIHALSAPGNTFIHAGANTGGPVDVALDNVPVGDSRGSTKLRGNSNVSAGGNTTNSPSNSRGVVDNVSNGTCPMKMIQ